jgi:hypothetical protein
MRKKALWLLLILGVVVGLLATPSVALADTWSDISDADWVAQYGVTAPQVAALADGYQDGTYRPYADVTRGQFAKMVLNGVGGSQAWPSTPTFPDVPSDSTYFSYVEGAVAHGLVEGFDSGDFDPNADILREQVATILARYLSSAELTTVGYITGAQGAHYTSLAAWYAAEGEAQLAGFSDGIIVNAAHRQGMAYLILRGVVQGANGWLNPSSPVMRAQSAAMILRTVTVAKTFEKPAAVAPTITSLNPSSGDPDGGNTVVIYGTNFTADSVVKFGSTTVPTADVDVVSPTRIYAIAPSGTEGTTVRVSVTTEYGTSPNTLADDYSYGAPTVKDLDPNTGDPDGGTVVVITGSGFSGQPTVKFGNKTVSSSNVEVDGPTQLTVVAPAGTAGTTVRVSVTNDYGTSPNTSADDYTYEEVGAPTITALDPAAGDPDGGDEVTIYGTNFTADSVVKFGSKTVSAANVEVYSSTRIYAIAPSGTEGTTVRVSVTTEYGTSPNTLADDYSYGAPTVKDLDPNTGDPDGGTVVVITGSGFSGQPTVKFGNKTVSSSNVEVDGPTQLTVVAPAGTAGTTVRVSVTNDYGTSPNTSADDYTYEEGAESGLSIDNAEYSLAGVDDWSGHPTTTAFANGTRLDLRVQVVDASGDPVANTDVSGSYPWALWYSYARSGWDMREHRHTRGEAPDSTTTDANGYLYWSNVGGFSDARYIVELGLDLNGSGAFGNAEPFATFTLTWEDR